MKAIVEFAAVAGLAASLSVAELEAKDLRMIAPTIPPHFDEDGNGRIGNVIRATLASCGHTVTFTMVPFGRHWKDYEDFDDYDGLATAEADQTFSGFTTQPFIQLQDGATVLVGSGLETIMSVEELHGKRIVAFPNADKILGIESSVPAFKSFRMRPNRFDHIRPLLSGRTDAILADGLITANFIAILRARAEDGQEPDVDTKLAVVFRKIFAAGPQRLYFRDQAIARDFDSCFRKLLAKGEIERITKPFVDKFRDVLSDQYPSH